MYARVLFFLGIDGSGKSTHARTIELLLKSQGRNVKYIWMRRKAYFSIPLLVISRILGITKVINYTNGSHWISIYPFYAYRPLQLLWPWFQFIDSLLHTFFTIKLPLLFNPKIIILVDRGMVDTLVDITVDVGIPKGYKRLETLFISSIPKNSYILVFDIDEKIAMQRKKDIPDIHYLKIRRKIYKRLASRYNWPIFSTESDFKTVHRKIMLMIQRNLEC